MAMNHYNMYASKNVWEQITCALKYIPFALLKLIAGYVF